MCIGSSFSSVYARVFGGDFYGLVSSVLWNMDVYSYLILIKIPVTYEVSNLLTIRILFMVGYTFFKPLCADLSWVWGYFQCSCCHSEFFSMCTCGWSVIMCQGPLWKGHHNHQQHKRNFWVDISFSGYGSWRGPHWGSCWIGATCFTSRVSIIAFPQCAYETALATPKGFLAIIVSTLTLYSTTHPDIIIRCKCDIFLAWSSTSFWAWL